MAVSYTNDDDDGSAMLLLYCCYVVVVNAGEFVGDISESPTG